VRVGERGKFGMRRAFLVRVCKSLIRTETTGEEPKVVPEIVCQDTKLAFGPKEDNRLLQDIPVGLRQPERGVSAGAVLPKDAVFRAIQRPVTGPRSNPVASLAFIEELNIRLEVDPLAISVIELQLMELLHHARHFTMKSLHGGSHSHP
jgi:hypothetical protein